MTNATTGGPRDGDGRVMSGAEKARALDARLKHEIRTNRTARNTAKAATLEGIVCRAALAVQAALVAGADTAIDPDFGRAIRMVTVRSVYLRFLAIAGHADATVRSIPQDMAPFRACHDALNEIKFGSPELLGSALEPLASKDDRRKRGAHFTPRSFASDIVSTTLRPLLPLVLPEDTMTLRICDPAVGGGVFLLELVSQLADRLVACGRFSDLYAARRMVAIHCAYGVDVDPVSVECTKLALRMECRAYEMSRHWLDDNIKCGDALVGLLPGQLRAFHWRLGTGEVTGMPVVDDEAMQLGAAARTERIRALAALAEGG